MLSSTSRGQDRHGVDIDQKCVKADASSWEESAPSKYEAGTHGRVVGCQDSLCILVRAQQRVTIPSSLLTGSAILAVALKSVHRKLGELLAGATRLVYLVKGSLARSVARHPGLLARLDG